LEGLGYTLLTRRYRGKHGEVDLVALDKETLVFVEVKFRATTRELPEESIDDVKKQRMISAASEWLGQYRGPDRYVRYDVVAIDPNGLRHYVEAFWP
jgi:putative endonuclease